MEKTFGPTTRKITRRRFDTVAEAASKAKLGDVIRVLPDAAVLCRPAPGYRVEMSARKGRPR